jgi:hypothetical protein
MTLSLNSSRNHNDDEDDKTNNDMLATAKIESKSISRGKKKNNNSKKRKRLTEEDIFAIQQERYDRLLFTAHKQLHKQAKQVKIFLLQKEIRKQKQANDNNSSINNTGETISKYKELDIELVTQQALRQLGIYHSNPRLKMVPPLVDPSDDGDDDNNSSKNSDDESHGRRKQDEEGESGKEIEKIATEVLNEIPSPISSDNPDYIAVTSVLKHKRFLQALEEWNKKVTEYRRWCVQLEERESYFQAKKMNSIDKKRKSSGRSSSSQPGRRHNQSQHPPHHHDRLQTTAEEPSALFCTLGGGGDGSGDDGESGNVDEYDEGKKKNRKGQRARKAKAMALEAKREGRSDFQSLNWRASSTAKSQQESSEHTDRSNNRGRAKNGSRSTKEEDFDVTKEKHKSKSTIPSTEPTEHPSWAAKQAQKTGIVAFQGKKITFD